jgi:hypothetical protein
VSGIIAICGSDAYLDGVDIGDIVTADLASPTGITIFGLDGAYPLIGEIIACAIYDISLSSGRLEAVTAAMSPFRTDFSVVFLPDTQLYLFNQPYVDAVTNWIIDNQTQFNIVAVLNAGDLTNSNEDSQWINADALYDTFDSINMPYLITCGNHDGDGASIPPVRGAMVDWNVYFPQSRYTSKLWWNGGFFESGQSQNAYLIIGDFLYITIEHAPRQVAIDWAKSIIAGNPTKKVVVTTHAMEYDETAARFSTDGDSYDANSYYASDTHDGDLIWDELKGCDNIILLMSGHFLNGHLQHHVATGTLGNQVDSQFINYQQTTDDTFRIVTFYGAGKRLLVRTYNPYTETWETSANGEYFVDLT